MCVCVQIWSFPGAYLHIQALHRTGMESNAANESMGGGGQEEEGVEEKGEEGSFRFSGIFFLLKVRGKHY